MNRAEEQIWSLVGEVEVRECSPHQSGFCSSFCVPRKYLGIREKTKPSLTIAEQTLLQINRSPLRLCCFLKKKSQIKKM